MGKNTTNKSSKNAGQKVKATKKELEHQNYRREKEASQLKERLIMEAKEKEEKEKRRLERLTSQRKKIEEMQRESILEQASVTFQNVKKKNKKAKNETTFTDEKKEEKECVNTNFNNSTHCPDPKTTHDDAYDDIWDEQPNTTTRDLAADEIWDEGGGDGSHNKKPFDTSEFTHGMPRQREKVWTSSRLGHGNQNYMRNERKYPSQDSFERRFPHSDYRPKGNKQEVAAQSSRRHATKWSPCPLLDEPKHRYNSPIGVMNAPEPTVNVWEERQSKMESIEQLKPHNVYEEEAMLHEALELSRKQALEDQRRRIELQEEYYKQMKYFSENPEIYTELEDTNINVNSRATAPHDDKDTCSDEIVDFNTNDINNYHGWSNTHLEHSASNVQYNDQKWDNHNSSKNGFTRSNSYEVDHKQKGAIPKCKQHKSSVTVEKMKENKVKETIAKYDDSVWDDLDDIEPHSSLTAKEHEFKITQDHQGDLPKCKVHVNGLSDEKLLDGSSKTVCHNSVEDDWSSQIIDNDVDKNVLGSSHKLGQVLKRERLLPSNPFNSQSQGKVEATFDEINKCSSKNDIHHNVDGWTDEYHQNALKNEQSHTKKIPQTPKAAVSTNVKKDKSKIPFHEKLADPQADDMSQRYINEWDDVWGDVQQEKPVRIKKVEDMKIPAPVQPRLSFISKPLKKTAVPGQDDSFSEKIEEPSYLLKKPAKNNQINKNTNGFENSDHDTWDEDLKHVLKSVKGIHLSSDETAPNSQTAPNSAIDLDRVDTKPPDKDVMGPTIINMTEEAVSSLEEDRASNSVTNIENWLATTCKENPSSEQYNVSRSEPENENTEPPLANNFEFLPTTAANKLSSNPHPEIDHSSPTIPPPVAVDEKNSAGCSTIGVIADPSPADVSRPPPYPLFAPPVVPPQMPLNPVSAATSFLWQQAFVCANPFIMQQLHALQMSYMSLGVPVPNGYFPAPPAIPDVALAPQTASPLFYGSQQPHQLQTQPSPVILPSSMGSYPISTHAAPTNAHAPPNRMENLQIPQVINPLIPPPTNFYSKPSATFPPGFNTGYSQSLDATSRFCNGISDNHIEGIPPPRPPDRRAPVADPKRQPMHRFSDFQSLLQQSRIDENP